MPSIRINGVGRKSPCSDRIDKKRSHSDVLEEIPPVEIPPATVERRHKSFQHVNVNESHRNDMGSYGTKMQRFQSDAAINGSMFMGPSHQDVNHPYVPQYHPLEFRQIARIEQQLLEYNFDRVRNTYLHQSRPFVHKQFPMNATSTQFNPTVLTPAEFSSASSKNNTILNTDTHVTRNDEILRKPFTAYNIFFSYDREIILALLPDLDTCNKSPLKMYESNSSSDEPQESVIEADVIFYTNAIESTNRTEEEVTKIISTAEENSFKRLQIILDRDKVKKTHRKSHGKIGFQTLSKLISSRWKKLSDREKTRFQILANQDRDRYKKEIEARTPRTVGHRII